MSKIVHWRSDYGRLIGYKATNERHPTYPQFVKLLAEFNLEFARLQGIETMYEFPSDFRTLDDVANSIENSIADEVSLSRRTIKAHHQEIREQTQRLNQYRQDIDKARQ